MKEARIQMLHAAFHATWIAGMLLIAVSLYATQLLVEQRVGEQKAAPALTLTFFTVPDPFEGIVGAFQSQAIQSWLQLSPHSRVVLFGKHPSLKTFTEGMHGRVLVDSDIDFTFSGAPLLNSMMARAYSSSSGISVLVDPQFILVKDFVDALRHVCNLQHNWLMIAMAKGIHSLPFQIDNVNGHWVNENNEVVHNEQVLAYARSHSSWDHCPGKYLWAWNADDVPLHIGVMPSFAYGFGFHHEWLLNEALASGIRFIFDGSDAISAFYISNFNSSNRIYLAPSFVTPEQQWETDKNAYLAALYGSFYFQPSNFVNTPVKLIMCGNQRLKVFHFLFPSFNVKLSHDEDVAFLTEDGRSEMFSVQHQHQHQAWNKTYLTTFRRFAMQTSFLRYLCQATDKRVRSKGPRSLMRKLMPEEDKAYCHCSNITQEALDRPFSKMKRPHKLESHKPLNHVLPFSLQSLLAMLSGSNETIVLSVVGYNYKDMLLNWVCRLRKLQITRFIVGAVDTQLYEFGLLQGLPVFMSGSSMDLSFNDCHFGSECFKKVTKLKSRMVLEVLKLGYKVLFSDVDVYWFKNPIEYLMSFGPKTIVAQSDQWNDTEAPNNPRRLNSGFYFVWPDNSTVAAFEMIVDHASISNMSEQPSFYDVLCGESGRHRLGDTQCLEPKTNVTTHFLDRELFPNGAFNNLWERRNVSEACIVQGCFVLHNNWISGRQRKLARQIASGLWDYDVVNRICIRSWQSHKQTSFLT